MGLLDLATMIFKPESPTTGIKHLEIISCHIDEETGNDKKKEKIFA